MQIQKTPHDTVMLNETSDIQVVSHVGIVLRYIWKFRKDFLVSLGSEHVKL